MKHCFSLIASCCVLVACASVPAKPQAAVEEAVIVERTPIPAFTGFLSTWIVFKARSSRGNFDFYYKHFEDGTVIPEIGDSCAFTYSLGHAEGVTGEGAIDVKPALVVDVLRCRSE